MEKIIKEFRVIETDDGFRIEIKGDKEQMREFVMSMDPRNWGRGRWGRRPRRGPWMFMWPWMWWCEEEAGPHEGRRVKVDVEAEDETD